jgi:hypothetical protein
VMTATGVLAEADRQAIVQALELKVSHTSSQVISLEEFTQLPKSSGDALEILANVGTKINLSDIQAMTSYELPFSSGISIKSLDEGGNFEGLIFGCLAPLFSDYTYHSPYNSKGKELADILCLDDDFVCFVQAKSLSILGNAKRPLSKRIEKMLFDQDAKHPGKAIRQALGTIREIRSGQKIYKDIKQTTEISIPHPQSITIHALILISEMHHSVDWEALAEILINNSDEASNIFLHVVDLEELQRISLAMRNATEFNNVLIGRWKTMRTHKNALVIVQFTTKKDRED